MAMLRTTGAIFPLTVLFGFLAGGLVVLQSLVLSKTINQVFLQKQTLEMVLPLLRLFLLIILIRVLFTVLNETFAGWMASKIKSNLREQLMQKINRLGPAYLRTQRSGELVTTALQGLDALDAYFSQYLPQVLLSAMLPLTILVVVFPLDVLTGVVFLVTAPLIPFFMALVGRTSEEQTKKQWSALARMGADFLDTLQGLTTLKTLGRSQDRASHLESVSDRYRMATMNVLRITFLSALVLELLATISTAVVAVEIGLRLLYGKIIFEQAFFILLIAPEFYLPMRNLGMRYHAGMTGVTAAGKIFSLLDLPEPPTVEVASRPSALPDLSLPFQLQLEQVSFQYENRSGQSLEGIDLTFTAGKHYALIGRSGAGKSTLMQLLMRYLLPTQGRILLNGQDIQSWPVELWRGQIAWVPQKPMLFNTSLLENIRLQDETISEERVWQAVRLAALEPLVQQFPRGLHTPLGEWGSRLSGGEGQRVALARAFLKNAPLVLMDEPTAHLDPELEASLDATTKVLLHQRTVITIAHRYSTIAHVDEVIVLDGGKIQRIGTPGEILPDQQELSHLFGSAEGVA
ncbi:MAG: thiol reductant ABC exporter subunit CydD [Anaerolineaceae bacterium]|nr:thiol reductant ABC exporter subunit CydD [Anaerolineaceae bacterium]